MFGFGSKSVNKKAEKMENKPRGKGRQLEAKEHKITSIQASTGIVFSLNAITILPLEHKQLQVVDIVGIRNVYGHPLWYEVSGVCEGKLVLITIHEPAYVFYEPQITLMDGDKIDA